MQINNIKIGEKKVKLHLLKIKVYVVVVGHFQLLLLLNRKGYLTD